MDESDVVTSLCLADGAFYDEEMIKRQYDDQASSDGKIVLKISDYIFMIRYGDNEDTSKNKELHFEKLSDFKIPLEFAGDESDLAPFYVLVKPVDGSLDFIRIKTTMKRHHHFESGKPLRVTKSFDIPLVDRQLAENGDLTIQCSSDIVIEHNVFIKGSESVLKADGSDIRIICGRTFYNNGTVCCNGLGGGEAGDIYIVADSIVNDGRIECTVNGQIRIFCREYINNGSIEPEPTVFKATEYHPLNPKSAETPLGLVEYLIYCLQNEFTVDMNKDDFYRKIGVAIQPQWTQQIVDHKLLYGTDQAQSAQKSMSAVPVSNMETGAILLKIIVVGDSEVGKSMLL